MPSLHQFPSRPGKALTAVEKTRLSSLPSRKVLRIEMLIVKSEPSLAHLVKHHNFLLLVVVVGVMFNF